MPDVAKKPELCLSAVTGEEGHPLENEDESGRRLCEYWGTIFQARVEGLRHHHHEDILRYVQQAPDDIRWTIDKTEFDDLIALEKIRLLGQMAIQMMPTSVPGILVRNSSLMLTELFWKEAPFCHLSRPSLVHHEMHTSFTEIHLFKTDD